MKITTLTPSKISSYATGVVAAASALPGCKIKQSQLLHAIANQEGFENWQAMKGVTDSRPAYSFQNKVVEVSYLVGLGFRVTAVDILVSIAGFEGAPLRSSNSFNPKDEFWFNELAPIHFGCHLDRSSGLSLTEAYENYGIALNEFVTLLDGLNRKRKALTLRDFAGWTIVVEGLGYHDASVREELLCAMRYSTVRSDKHDLNEVLGLCRQAKSGTRPEHMLFNAQEVSDATDYTNIVANERSDSVKYSIAVESLSGSFQCALVGELYAPFEALAMINTRKIGDADGKVKRRVKFFKYDELSCYDVFPVAPAESVVRLEIDESGRLDIAIPSINYNVFADPAEMFDMWVLFARVFVTLESENIELPDVVRKVYSLEDCIKCPKQTMVLTSNAVSSTILDGVSLGVSAMHQALEQLLRHMHGGIQIDTALAALYPGRFRNIQNAKGEKYRVYQEAYDDLSSMVRSSRQLSFMDGALSTIVLSGKSRR